MSQIYAQVLHGNKWKKNTFQSQIYDLQHIMTNQPKPDTYFGHFFTWEESSKQEVGRSALLNFQLLAHASSYDFITAIAASIPET